MAAYCWATSGESAFCLTDLDGSQAPMKGSANAEMRFLIKIFARHGTKADAIILFQEQYNKNPTQRQIALADLGKWVGDKRERISQNWRMMLFKKYRKDYEEETKRLPIRDPDWRAEQYQKLYYNALARSRETGNSTRCTDILTLMAKEEAGAYTPKTQTFNIDNRSQHINMSDDELNKRFNAVMKKLGQFGLVHSPDMPLIQRGDHVIEIEAEGDEE